MDRFNQYRVFVQVAEMGSFIRAAHALEVPRASVSAAVQQLETQLGGGEHYEYQKASPAVLAKVAQIKAIAARFQVDVKAAALQFSLANPAVAAVIPGSSRPGRMAEDLAALDAVIPAEFWAEMRRQKLVADNAPLPIR